MTRIYLHIGGEPVCVRVCVSGVRVCFDFNCIHPIICGLTCDHRIETTKKRKTNKFCFGGG